MKFNVVYEGKISGGEECDADCHEANFDSIMEELLRLDADDADLGMTASTGAFDISLTIDADDFDEAIKKALVLIRTAAHAAGLGTAEIGLHGWSYEDKTTVASRA